MLSATGIPVDGNALGQTETSRGLSNLRDRFLEWSFLKLEGDEPLQGGTNQQRLRVVIGVRIGRFGGSDRGCSSGTTPRRAHSISGAVVTKVVQVLIALASCNVESPVPAGSSHPKILDQLSCLEELDQVVHLSEAQLTVLGPSGQQSGSASADPRCFAGDRQQPVLDGVDQSQLLEHQPERFAERDPFQVQRDTERSWSSRPRSVRPDRRRSGSRRADPGTLSRSLMYLITSSSGVSLANGHRDAFLSAARTARVFASSSGLASSS